MKKVKFSAISASGNEAALAGCIKNDYEAQLDCDYIQAFKDANEGEVATVYSVTVIVEEKERLK